MQEGIKGPSRKDVCKRNRERDEGLCRDVRRIHRTVVKVHGRGNEEGDANAIVVYAKSRRTGTQPHHAVAGTGTGEGVNGGSSVSAMTCEASVGAIGIGATVTGGAGEGASAAGGWGAGWLISGPAGTSSGSSGMGGSRLGMG